ncbi:cytosolic sulfotransferase 2-like [Thalassophryne amazonica]|uniref:cytosolic sulfotransferase 2-like n=1 Tax=Thalassophryne amazonica TaxID=390379 RepID=UPI0014723ED9|nr:cytosolic sulfotransferase 2-like [Thalassophryne amazonica]
MDYVNKVKQFMQQPIPVEANRPTPIDFHGLPLTKYYTDNWDDVQSFKARPDDILLVSYPKSGSTWLSYILDLLYFGQTCPERQTSIPIYLRVPFLDMQIPSFPSGKEVADELPTTPRIMKSHRPAQFLPQSFWEQNCKIVYVARNAKDTAVSYFHYMRMSSIQPEPGDWGTHFHRFMEGRMVHGSWYDHVNSWWEKKQTYSNLHYMFYEDIIEDPAREINQLCSFLGLCLSAEEKEKVMTDMKFEAMAQNKMANYSTIAPLNQNVSTFLRKGKVGDWKNHFTVSQNEMFDEDYKQKMKNPSLHFRTEI